MRYININVSNLYLFLSERTAMPVVLTESELDQDFVNHVMS